MPFPKLKISDNEGNTVDVTDNALDVNIAGGSAAINIGNVDLMLDGAVPVLGGAGNVADGVLRITIADNDPHWGEVGTAADNDGVAHGQLRAIANNTSNMQSDISSVMTNTSNLYTAVVFATSTTGGQYAEGDGAFLATGVRNDTLASLVSVDHDHAPYQVKASGALYVTGESLQADSVTAYGFGIMGEAKVIDGSALPNAVSEGHAGRVASSRAGIQYVCLTDQAGLILHPNATDDTAQDATPGILNVGGEYRSSKTTYTNGDASILSSSIYGHLNIAGSHVDDAGFTLGTDSGVMMMGFAGTQSVNANDAAALRCSTDGNLHVIHQGVTIVSEIEEDVTVTGTVTANLGTTDNAVLDAIAGSLEILDDWDDSNYANVNIDLAGSDAPTGGGVESGALRVTLANDSTGVISIDDGGNTITVDGTVTANLGTTDNAVLDAIAASLALLDNSIASGNELQVDVVASLPAGTNAIGKLSANSGVDIGDVDITSIAAGDNNIGNVDIVTLPASTNTLEVVGDAAEDAAVAGNPVLVGGRYDSSDRSLDDGDVGAIALNEEGSVKINWEGDLSVSGSVLDTVQSPYSGASRCIRVADAVRNDTLSALTNSTDGDWTPAQVDAQGALYTTHGITGMQSDNNEGVDDTTAEVLKSSTLCKRVDMQADPSNTGYIYVGGSDVSATKGIRLAPGDFYSIDVDNTADIYVLASVDEEDIHFTYYT